jgi:hypothetical protein
MRESPEQGHLARPEVAIMGKPKELSAKPKKATLLTPTIDARLLKVCERLRGLATAIEDRYQFGVVYLFNVSSG